MHPGQSADDGAGAAGVIQKIVGDIQTGGSQPPGAGVQMLLHGGKHRRQAVGFIGVFRRLTKQGALLSKPFQFRRAKQR